MPNLAPPPSGCASRSCGVRTADTPEKRGTGKNDDDTLDGRFRRRQRTDKIASSAMPIAPMIA